MKHCLKKEAIDSVIIKLKDKYNMSGYSGLIKAVLLRKSTDIFISDLSFPDANIEQMVKKGI